MEQGERGYRTEEEEIEWVTEDKKGKKDIQ